MKAKNRYKAFISYHRESEDELAVALKKALQKFAKPWNKRRALRVYRDAANQNLTPDLFDSLKRAMDDSGFLILMASPASAESLWVPREVQYWLDQKLSAQLLIVVCAGTAEWDAAKNDFDWKVTDCLPKNLSGAFTGEPLYLDLRKIRTNRNLTLTNQQFREKVAQLVATLNGDTLEDTYGEEARQFQKFKRIRRGAIVLLTLLTLGALVGAYLARENSIEASSNLALTQWGNGILYRDNLGDSTHAAHWFAKAVSSPDDKLSDSSRLAATYAVRGISLTRPIDSTDTSSGAEFKSDNEYFLTWGINGVVRLRHPDTGEIVSQISHEKGVKQAAYHAGTGLVLSVDTRKKSSRDKHRTLRLWSACSGQQTAMPDCEKSPQLIWQHEPVEGAAFSPDGTQILAWSGPGGLRLWPALSEAALPGFPCNDASTTCGEPLVRGARFSHTGNRVISWHFDMKVRVWDVTKGVEISSPQCDTTPKQLCHDGTIEGATLDSDSNRALSWGWDKTLRLWQLPDGKEVMRFQHESAVHGAMFSKDESQILSWSREGTLRLWNVVGGNVPFKANHRATIEGAMFSADQAHILSWGWDGTVRLWDVASQKEVISPLHNGKSVSAATLFASGNRIISQSNDGSLRWWAVSAGKQIVENRCGEDPVLCHDHKVVGARFIDNAASVLSWSFDNTLRLWDSVTGLQKIRPQCDEDSPVLCHEDSVIGAEFYSNKQNEKRILSWSTDETVRLWDMDNGSLIKKYDGHREKVLGALLNREKDKFLSWSEDKTVRLWDLASGSQLYNELSHDHEVRGASFNPDATLILSWDADLKDQASIYLWDANSGKRKIQAECGESPVLCHQGQVRGAQFTSDGARILSWSDDRSVRLWDAQTGQLVTVPMMHANGVKGAGFNQDETLILSWDVDPDGQARLYLWDAGSGEQLVHATCGENPVFCHKDMIRGAAFSSREDLILSWSDDRSVRLWDTYSGQGMARSMLHDKDVKGARFNRSENRILSWGEDGAVRLWDAQTGTEAITPLIHGKKLAGAAFNPDETRVLSWGEDHELRLWDIGYEYESPANSSSMIKLIELLTGSRMADTKMIKLIELLTGTRMTDTNELEVLSSEEWEKIQELDGNSSPEL
jgi:WD40 repeat protein